MANRKRNIQMKFYVTENKKRLTDERIKLLASLPHSISFSFGNELKAEICNGHFDYYLNSSPQPFH